MKNQGMKSLTETFSRWQLVVLFVMVVAFYHPLSEMGVGMLGVKPSFIASILADAFAAGAIAWVTTFVMLHLTPKPHVKPPKQN